MATDTKTTTSAAGGFKPFAAGLVIGLIVGGFAGVLLPEVSRMNAPAPGATQGPAPADLTPPPSTQGDPEAEQPTPADLEDAANDAADQVQDTANDAMDAANDAINNANPDQP